MMGRKNDLTGKAFLWLLTMAVAANMIVVSARAEALAGIGAAAEGSEKGKEQEELPELRPPMTEPLEIEDWTESADTQTTEDWTELPDTESVQTEQWTEAWGSESTETEDFEETEGIYTEDWSEEQTDGSLWETEDIYGEPSEQEPDSDGGLIEQPETEDFETEQTSEWLTDTGTEDTDWETEEGQTDSEWEDWTDPIETEDWETETETPEDETDFLDEVITEAESETETEEGVPVLADTNGDAEIDIFSPEGETFPMGTTLRLLSISDVVGEVAEKEERCEEMEKFLKSGWEEDSFENMRTFLSYYILMTDEQGNEIDLPDSAEIRFKIHDALFYEDALNRNDVYRIACQGKGDMFVEIEEKEMLRDDEEQTVIFMFQTEQLGWITLLQTDAEWELDEAQQEDMPMTYAALDPSGSKVTDSGSGFVKMSPSNMDGSFRPAHWYDGISSFAPFNNAGSAVKTMTVDSGGGAHIFYPVNNNAKGKFGGIYKKILYKDGQWYDLVMTVTDYTNKTYAGTAGDVVDSYPPIGFSTSGIRWRFSPAMGEYTMKLQFCRSDDAGQTPVKLDTRFQWWEIDNSQRFGIRLGNGSYSAKYYQSNNCSVHYKTQTAADGNKYLFLTAREEASSGDTRGNVGFALSKCSTYFVVIGYRDHIQDDADYRASKLKIQEWNDALSSGKAGDVTLGMLVQSDVDVPIPPDNSYPKKYVSNDSNSWSKSNTLSKVNSEYYYKIRQYIPWQTSNNYFSSFSIKDVLPDGVDYVGDFKVTRVEDSSGVTGKFKCSADKDTVVVTPTDAFLKNSGFYGYTFDIVFKVQMDPSEMTAAYSGNTASYKVSNKAVENLTFLNDGGSYKNESNAVTTDASVTRKTQGAPKKSLDANENLTTKDLGTAADVITFSVYQSIPANDKAWRPSQVTMTDTLEGCLQYKSAKVYQKGENGYAEASGWKASVSGQTVSITKSFHPSNVSLRFDITCSIRDKYDMNKYLQISGSKRWYVIPNKAEVELAWEHGSPLSVKNTTNEVTVRFYGGPVTAHLSLTKEIQTADIVWAHGNPTFTFKIEGEDVDGGRHTYYRTVEFTPSNVAKTERSSLAAAVEVPAGWYTVVEEKTMRYRLDSIYNVTKGNVTGSTVVFDVSDGGDASAVFYNIKTTDTGETHSAFVRNVIG